MSKFWVKARRSFTDTRLGSVSAGQRLLLDHGLILQLEELDFVAREESFRAATAPQNRPLTGLARSPASSPVAPASQPKIANLSEAPAGAPSLSTTAIASPPGPTRSTQPTSSGGSNTSNKSSKTSKANAGRSVGKALHTSAPGTSRRATAQASARAR